MTVCRVRNKTCKQHHLSPCGEVVEVQSAIEMAWRWNYNVCCSSVAVYTLQDIALLYYFKQCSQKQRLFYSRVAPGMLKKYKLREIKNSICCRAVQSRARRVFSYSYTVRQMRRTAKRAGVYNIQKYMHNIIIIKLQQRVFVCASMFAYGNIRLYIKKYII